jgi:hypothetical protein
MIFLGLIDLLASVCLFLHIFDSKNILGYGITQLNWFCIVMGTLLILKSFISFCGFPSDMGSIFMGLIDLISGIIFILMLWFIIPTWLLIIMGLLMLYKGVVSFGGSQ